MRLLHLTPAPAWAGARRAGRLPAEAPGPGEFLHACTASQLAGVLARVPAAAVVGATATAPPVLLVLDVAVCEAAGTQVRWAAADRADGPFPHVHGAVPVAAVVAAIELVPGPDGTPGAPDPAVLAALGVLVAPPRDGPPTA